MSAQPKLLFKNAIVTGGATGLGFALTQKLVAMGTKVTICGRRQEKLKSAAAHSKLINATQCDITNTDDQLALFKSAAQFGEINVDLLVNNAGLLILSNKGKDVAQMFEVNTFAPMQLAAIFLDQAPNDGKIIQIGSIAGSIPIKKLASYGASKAALHYATRVWRPIAAEQNCKVHYVHTPGIYTDMSDALNVKKFSTERIATRILKAAMKGQEEIKPSFESHLAYLGMRIAPRLTEKIANRRYENSN